MNCPYNGFKECDWENCAARMYVKSPVGSENYMRVCAIAYNGEVPRQQEGKNMSSIINDVDCECSYCANAGNKNICSNCVRDNKLEPIEHHQTLTNADRIRTMSDKEIAKTIVKITRYLNKGKVYYCRPFGRVNTIDADMACYEWIKWLRQPAEELGGLNNSEDF